MRITATYRIVTPMFCSGADPHRAELRVPSLKGALRFWWRAAMWGRVNDAGPLRDREAALFGSTRTGRSRVRLRIVEEQLEKPVEPGAPFTGDKLEGAHYLAYGVMKGGRLVRGMVPGGTFTMECRLDSPARQEDRDDVTRALVMLGTVGGLGSKARKGFGSLSLISLTVDGRQEPLPDPPADRLRMVVGDRLSADLPEWTAWSRHSRLVLGGAGHQRGATTVLDLLGREQVHFRSWGRNGHVLGRASERNFPGDHDRRSDHRMAFGLPHNYKPRNQEERGPASQVRPHQHDRRASPLFLHVHQPDPAAPARAVVAFLPARFLPSGEQVRRFGKPEPVPAGVSEETLWFPVHAFLDRLVSGDQPPAARPGYQHLGSDRWWRRATALEAEEVTLG